MDAGALAAQVEVSEGREVVVVVGPTASGKTALAIELARRLDGEVVGVDSVQIYRRFDLGSGKPTGVERARVPYHLIDFADPHAPMNAGGFAERAREVIEEIQARGRRPVLCGGSYLWVKAIVGGLVSVPPSSTEIRARHQREAEEQGRAALHARLQEVDPALAARLAPQDLVRVSRGLEVFELTGERLSELQARHQASSGAGMAHQLVGVRWTREQLAARIEARTRLWLEAGWIEEVRALVADGYGATRPMGSIGYAQVRDHLEGKIARADLDEAINRATRVFVRRQMTWLRDAPVRWVDATEG